MPITNEDILSVDSPYDLDSDGYLSQEERLAIAPSEFVGKAERDALLYSSEGRKPPEAVEEEMEPVAPHEEMNIGEIFTTVLNESAAGRDPLATLLPQDPATLPARPHEYNAYLEDPYLSAAMNDEEKRLLKKARGFDYDNENIYIGAPTPEGPMGKEEVDSHRREQQLAHTRAKAAIKLLEEEKTRAEEWAAKHPSPSIDRANPLKTYREVRRAGLETIGMTGHEGEGTLPAPIRGMTQGLLVDFPATFLEFSLRALALIDRSTEKLGPLGWAVAPARKGLSAFHRWSGYTPDMMDRDATDIARERRAYDQAQRVLDTTDPMVTSVFPETVFTPAAPGIGEDWTRAVRGGTKSIFENIPLIFNAPTMIAYHSFKAGHDQWIDSKDLGRSDVDAGIDALLSGAITGATVGLFIKVGAPTLERSMLNMGKNLRGATAPALRAASRVPGGAMSRSIARSGVVRATRELGQAVALGAGAEMLEEATDYTLQAAMQVHRGVDPHALDSKQYWDGLGEVMRTAAVGGAMGGVLDVSTRPEAELEEAQEGVPEAELEALRKSVEKLVKDADSGAKGAATALIEANKHLGIISEKDIRETDGAAFEQLLEGIDAALSSQSPETRRKIIELLVSLPPVPTDRAGFTAATGRKGNQAFREMYADVIEGLRTAVPSMTAEVIGEELGAETVTPAMESIAEGWRGVLQERMIQAEQGRDLLSQLTKKEMGDPSTISDEKIQQIFERHSELFAEQALGREATPEAKQAWIEAEGVPPAWGFAPGVNLAEARVVTESRIKALKDKMKGKGSRADRAELAKMQETLTQLDRLAARKREAIGNIIAEIQSPSQPAQTFREYHRSHPLNPELRAEKAATGPLKDLAQDIPTDKIPGLMRQLQSAFPDVVAKLKKKQEEDAATKQKADEADRKRLQKDLDKLREKEAKEASETKEEAPSDPKVITFEWEGVDSSGRDVRGVVEARTEEEAESLVESHDDLLVTKLTKKPTLAEPAETAPPTPDPFPAEPEETVTEEPTLDDTPEQAAEKVRKHTVKNEQLWEEAAPAREGDHQADIELIYEALPGVDAVVPHDGFAPVGEGKRLYEVFFKNGVKVDLVVSDNVEVPEKWLAKAMATYGVENTPANRKAFQKSARGSFTLTTGKHRLDTAGIIRLRSDLSQDGMTQTAKHEHFHMLERLGFITPKELAALKETYFDPKRNKSLSEQLAEKSQLWRPGGTLYYKMKRMIKSLMRLMTGFAKTSKLTGEEVADRIARGEMDTRRSANDAVQALRDAGGPTGISEIAVELGEETYARWKRNPSSLPNEVRWSIIDKYQMDGRELTPQEAEIWDSDPVWFTAATEAMLSDDVSASADIEGIDFEERSGFVQHPVDKRAGNILVELDVASVDSQLPNDQRIGRGGKGSIVDPVGMSRYDRFLAWDRGEKTPGRRGEGIPGRGDLEGIEAPSMGINPGGQLVFENGRHRFAALRDQERRVFASMSPQDAAAARDKGLVVSRESDDISYSADMPEGRELTVIEKLVRTAKGRKLATQRHEASRPTILSPASNVIVARVRAEVAADPIAAYKKLEPLLDERDAAAPGKELDAFFGPNSTESSALLKSVEVELLGMDQERSDVREAIEKIGYTAYDVNRHESDMLRRNRASRSAKFGPERMKPAGFNKAMIQDVLQSIPVEVRSKVMATLRESRAKGGYEHDMRGDGWVDRMAGKVDDQGISAETMQFVHDAKYLLKDDAFATQTLDILFDTWRSLGILSGPATHVANGIGFASLTMWDTAVESTGEAMVANIMERFISKETLAKMGWEVDEEGNHGVRTKEEIRAMFGSALQDGAKNGWKNAMFALRYEVDRQALLLQKEGADRDNISRTPSLTGPKGSLKYLLGRGQRGSYTALQFLDQFNRTMAGHMLAKAYALRIATAKYDTAEDIAEAAAKMYEDMGSPAWQRADQEALEFGAQNRENLGMISTSLKPLGDLAMKHASKGPGYVVPFVMTTLRLTDQAMLRLPGLGLAQQFYMDTRNRGMTRVESLQHMGHPRTVARQMLGMIGLAVVMGLRQMDDDEKPLITGAKGAKDRRTRENLYAVAPPMSFRFPGTDTYYSYARIDPFAGVLATLVDTADNIANVTPGEAVRDAMSQINERTYLEGLVDFVKVMDDVASGGKRKELERWGINFATSWVPNIIRQPLKAIDPNLAERRLWGKGEDARNRMLKRMATGTELVPGWDTPRYDRWGRPIQKTDPAGPPLTDMIWRTVMPFRAQNTSKSLQFDLALYRWNVEHPEEEYFLMTPQKYFKHEGEQYYLTDEQWANYMKYSGRLARLAVQGLKIDPGSPDAEDIEGGLDAYKKAVASVRELLKPYWLRGEAGRIDSLDSIRD